MYSTPKICFSLLQRGSLFYYKHLILCIKLCARISCCIIIVLFWASSYFLITSRLHRTAFMYVHVCTSLMILMEMLLDVVELASKLPRSVFAGSLIKSKFHTIFIWRVREFVKSRSIVLVYSQCNISNTIKLMRMVDD